MADYLDSADVWTVLDLIVAEWMSDVTSVQCFDLRLVERAKVLNAARRQRAADLKDDVAFQEMTEAIAAYLREKGWTVRAMGAPAVEQAVGPGSLNSNPGLLNSNFRFVIEFTGRRTVPPPTILIPSDGGAH